MDITVMQLGDLRPDDGSERMFQEEMDRLECSYRLLCEDLERIRRNRLRIREEARTLLDVCANLSESLREKEEKLADLQVQFEMAVDVEKLKAGTLERCQNEVQNVEVTALMCEISLRTVQIDMLGIQRKCYVADSASTGDSERLEHQKIQAAYLELRMKEEHQMLHHVELFRRNAESEWAKSVDEAEVIRKQLEWTWHAVESGRKELERVREELKVKNSHLTELDIQWIAGCKKKFRLEDYDAFLQRCRKPLDSAILRSPSDLDSSKGEKICLLLQRHSSGTWQVKSASDC